MLRSLSFSLPSSPAPLSGGERGTTHRAPCAPGLGDFVQAVFGVTLNRVALMMFVGNTFKGPKRVCVV